MQEFASFALNIVVYNPWLWGSRKSTNEFPDHRPAYEVVSPSSPRLLSGCYLASRLIALP